MTKGSCSSNKAKIARRVVEVLEYFDDQHSEATVMDIVRRYDRPQSSTSELLSSLVELGILHKDPHSRSYSPTARAALLGSAGQPDMIRDGRMVRLMERLVAQTGLDVALFSMVGLDTQVVNARSGKRSMYNDKEQLFGGTKETLAFNAQGCLLLSTVEKTRREGMVRRMNAEAEESCKFSHKEIMERIDACVERRYVVGPAGYGTDRKILAALMPRQPDNHPLAIGILYRAEDKVVPENLLRCLGDAMRKCLPDPESANVEQFPHAA